MLSLNRSILFLILLCGLVTWLPRILPFVLSKRVTFPPLFEEFLGYLPICILVALFFQNILIGRVGKLPGVNIPVLIASLPTILVAVKSKDLMWTVIVGILSMALLRNFL